jgi:hypothetical protein
MTIGMNAQRERGRTSSSRTFVSTRRRRPQPWLTKPSATRRIHGESRDSPPGATMQARHLVCVLWLSVIALFGACSASPGRRGGGRAVARQGAVISRGDHHAHPGHVVARTLDTVPRAGLVVGARPSPARPASAREIRRTVGVLRARAGYAVVAGRTRLADAAGRVARAARDADLLAHASARGRHAD